MILVVGASGVLGGEAAKQLIAAGHKVRAATRAPETLADLQQLGAEIVTADLIDAASLVRACTGVDAVLAAAHSMMGTGRYSSDAVDGAGHFALVDAARSVGVKRFLYVSARGVSFEHPVDFFRTKVRVEEHLRASQLDFTILRPTAFMEWHVHNLLGKGIVEEGRTTIFGSGSTPTNFVAARDVAHIAVSALTDPKTSGKTLEIGGPDNVTKRQLVEMYERCLGRSAKVRRVPTLAMRIMAPLVRPLNPVLGRLLTMGVWGDTTDQTFDVRAMPQEYVARLTRVENFVRDRTRPTPR